MVLETNRSKSAGRTVLLVLAKKELGNLEMLFGYPRAPLGSQSKQDFRWESFTLMWVSKLGHARLWWAKPNLKFTTDRISYCYTQCCCLLFKCNFVPDLSLKANTPFPPPGVLFHSWFRHRLASTG